MTVAVHYEPKKEADLPNTLDCRGWWLHEKYEGFRVFWNGTILRTMHGIPIHVPSSLQLPPVAIEAQLWYVMSVFYHHSVAVHSLVRIPCGCNH